MTDSAIPTDANDLSFEDFPSQLVVLLYDAAIEGLADAAAAIADGDVEGRFMATARTAEIIDRLHAALDMEQGGEIAANLDQLYRFVLTQLPMLNLHNDPAITESLIALLKPLRDSWAELDSRIREEVEQAEFVASADGASKAQSNLPMAVL